jgi:hypothetical protein
MSMFLQIKLGAGSDLKEVYNEYEYTAAAATVL